jgi:hypothetical protein
MDDDEKRLLLMRMGQVGERHSTLAFIRERAANIRRYPFESRAKADAMVIAARELQDVADRLEQGAHLPVPDKRA